MCSPLVGWVKPRPWACRKNRPGPEGALGRPVTGIAHHGMADRRHVDADLVRPSALQAQFDERRRAGEVAAFQHREAGAGGPPTGRDRHLRRRAGGAPDGGVDLSTVVGHRSLDQGQVTTLHAAVGQLGHEGAVGRLGPGHREEPRRALVEPVHNARPVRRADPGATSADRSGKRGSSPPTSVPSWCPAPGCTTRPAGLSTTATSASAWTTANSTPASGLDVRAPWLGQGDGQDGTLVKGIATDRHHRAVDTNASGGDEHGGHRTARRWPAWPRHGLPAPRRGAVGPRRPWRRQDRSCPRSRRMRKEERCHQDDDSHRDARVGHVEGRPVAQRDEVGHQPMMPARAPARSGSPPLPRAPVPHRWPGSRCGPVPPGRRGPPRRRRAGS